MEDPRAAFSEQSPVEAPTQRAHRISETFSLRTKTGRIGAAILIIAFTLIVTPFLLPSPAAQPAQSTLTVDVGGTAEAWPTAPATYVPPVAPPALSLRAVPTPIPLPAPQWQEMSHLTVIEFRMSTIAEVQRTANVALLGDLITDHLLLKATGEIQMGIDLSQVRDVQIDDDTIHFTAPRPEILSVELLPDKSQIFESRQVLFLSNYTGLETEALEAARQQLRAEVAENSSMTQLAEEFGRLKLTDFLRKVGYTNVEVTFVEGESTDD